MKTKAISYLRVSSISQVDGDGLPRQRDKASDFAAQEKYNLTEEFTDEGISGTNDIANRPGLAALLDRVQSNGVKIVLVENATRLARDLMIQEIILSDFRKLGVRVIECEGGNDLTENDDPTAVMVRQVMGAFAQFEKTILVQKLRASRERIRRAGNRCEGRKPYGFNPQERVILSRMKKLRRKPRGGTRLSYGVIAKQLSAEGFKPRKGSEWGASSVQAILKRLG